MLNLIKQELKRNKLSTYIGPSIISCVVLIVFTYFVAYVAQVENDVQFQNYNNIFRFTGIMGLIIFSVIAATMYSRLVINEYSGARMALLFSYPVSRKKIFLSKILIAFTFTTISMALCTAIPLTLFAITETISPIVNDIISFKLLFAEFQTICISALAVGGVGIVSMRLGFIKKSVPTTLVTAFIFSGMLGNVAITCAGNLIISAIIISIILITSLAVIIELGNKINIMEVE
jgi:ABC-type transport system involved in multi-copper enzyme maturation permease subunit